MTSDDFTPKYKRFHLRQIAGLAARTSVLPVACCTVTSGRKKTGVQSNFATWKVIKASWHSLSDFPKSLLERPLKSLCWRRKPEAAARWRSRGTWMNCSTGISNQKVFLKLNYNIDNLTPAAIDTKLPETLAKELPKADAEQNTSVLFNSYMEELHSAQARRLLLAEINQANKTTLRLIAGVTPLVNRIPEAGELRKWGVILARLKRVSVNIFGLEILRHIDPSRVSSGVWNKPQLQRSVQLAIGVASAEHKRVSHRFPSLPKNG